MSVDHDLEAACTRLNALWESAHDVLRDLRAGQEVSVSFKAGETDEVYSLAWIKLDNVWSIVVSRGDAPYQLLASAPIRMRIICVNQFGFLRDKVEAAKGFLVKDIEAAANNLESQLKILS